MERHLQGDKNVCARTVGNAILIPEGPSSLLRKKVLCMEIIHQVHDERFHNAQDRS